MYGGLLENTPLAQEGDEGLFSLHWRQRSVICIELRPQRSLPRASRFQPLFLKINFRAERCEGSQSNFKLGQCEICVDIGGKRF